jgi:hypothetical protein
MRTYLVERTDKWGYDEYDKFVCFANSPEEAKQLHPSDFYVWKDDCWQMAYSDGSFSKEDMKYSSWVMPDQMKVWEVDHTRAKKPEVILASYNAG